MNAPRRLMAFVIVFSLLSVSCGVLPIAHNDFADSRVSTAYSPTEFSSQAIFAERVLGRLDTGLQPEELTRLAAAVAAESKRVGIPIELVLGLIRVESSGYNFAVSYVGAMGLMQLMPDTAEAVASRVGVRWDGPSTLFDPVANVRLGVDYLRELIDRYGSVKTALAAYNWGPTRIAERIRRGQSIPVSYANKVMVASERAKTALL